MLGIDADCGKVCPERRDRVGSASVDVGIYMQYALLDHERVISDADRNGALDGDGEAVVAVQRVLHFVGRNGEGLSRDDLFSQVDQISLLHADAAVSDQMADI